MEVEIRFAYPDESLTIAQLIESAFISYKALYTDEAYLATAIAPEVILARIQKGAVFVAVQKDQIVGTVAFEISEKGLLLRSMAVHPDCRGRKIGSQLLAAIESQAVSSGVIRLYLYTTPFLHRAIKLYSSQGYSRKSNKTKDFFGTPIFRMEKTLPNSNP